MALAGNLHLLGHARRVITTSSPTIDKRDTNPRARDASMLVNWDRRLNPLQNLIFLTMGSSDLPIYQLDEDDPAFDAALSVSQDSMERGMGGLPTIEVASVQDVVVPSTGLPVRIYYPPVAACDESEACEVTARSLAWTLYLHGGGWVQGSLDTHDAFCRRLCVDSGVAIASAGYRLAPAAKWPAQPIDAFAALKALVKGEVATSFPLDPARVAIAGDSAGGTIAAQVAVAARDAGIPLRLQLLLCPALDATCSCASHEENRKAPMLSAAGMQWFWSRYLPAAEPQQSEESTGAPEAAAVDAAAAAAASPLLHDLSKLSGLAPAHIVTAECDVLRDEGELYAERLRSAGVEASAVRYDGAVHAFLVYAGTPFALGDKALGDAVRVLRAALE